MKKLVALVLFIFLLFISYYLISRRPHNYNISYVLGGYNIDESYDKDKKIYSFKINANDDEYLLNIKNDYLVKRKVITSVTQKDNCITIDSNLLNNYSLCKKDGKYYTDFYSSKLNDRKIETFEGIDIYDLSNHTYFLWNYNKLIALKNKNYSKISLFNNDLYNLDLFYQLDRYLIVPNYDESYTFSSLFIVDSKNFKTNKVYLNIDLYYDSYFVGNYKDDIYLYDHKKETLYRINPFKKTIYKNKFEYYDNNKWIDASKRDFKNEKIYFNMTKDFYYSVDNKKLMYHTPSYDINVTNINVDYLVKSDEKEAFFISNGILYYVNIYNTINKVVGYKEWNYNKGNIFVF